MKRKRTRAASVIPRVLGQKIFASLQVNEHARCALVCRHWKSIADSPTYSNLTLVQPSPSAIWLARNAKPCVLTLHFLYSLPFDLSGFTNLREVTINLCMMFGSDAFATLAEKTLAGRSFRLGLTVDLDLWKDIFLDLVQRLRPEDLVLKTSGGPLKKFNLYECDLARIRVVERLTLTRGYFMATVTFTSLTHLALQSYYSPNDLRMTLFPNLTTLDIRNSNVNLRYCHSLTRLTTLIVIDGILGPKARDFVALKHLVTSQVQDGLLAEFGCWEQLESLFVDTLPTSGVSLPRLLRLGIEDQVERVLRSLDVGPDLRELTLRSRGPLLCDLTVGLSGLTDIVLQAVPTIEWRQRVSNATQPSISSELLRQFPRLRNLTIPTDVAVDAKPGVNVMRDDSVCAILSFIKSFEP